MKVKIAESKLMNAEINNIHSLEQATIPMLQDFVDSCMRTTSPKTGKLIKINTFKWRKSNLIDLIEDSGYTRDALEFINVNYTYDIEVRKVTKLETVY